MSFGAVIFCCDIEIIYKLQVTPLNGVLEIQGWTSEQNVRFSTLGISLTKGLGVIVIEKCYPMVISHSNFRVQRITVLEEWNQKD